MAGSQDYADDPRNDKVLIYLNGAMVARNKATVSVFDAGFSMGDGVWEGLRLHKRALLFMGDHLDRLFEGARAIGLTLPARGDIEAALHGTVEANGMTDGAHLRLMVTRGLKTTVNQDPRNAVGRPTVVITAEYKTPGVSVEGRGLRLHTSQIRCSSPAMFDMRLNSHSRLNLITALLEAINAGADEALMLDPAGFISTCNATNFFFVAGGVVFTSRGDFCFNGITRSHIIELCRANGLTIRLGAFPLDAAHRAEEAFVTGTLGGVTPVGEIDGRRLPTSPGPFTVRIAGLYEALKDADAAGAGRS